MVTSDSPNAGRMIGSEILTFDHAVVPGEAGRKKTVHIDVSAAARVGDVLFVACDETRGIERLRHDGTGWGNHRHFAIGDIIGQLPGAALGIGPADPDQEIDIEGISVDNGWLWLTGSQSRKRKKPKPGQAPEPALDRLRTTEFEENRQFIGRLPLAEVDGVLAPVRKHGKRRAAHVKFSPGGRIRKWLNGDPLFRDFLALPSKDNGLDIEGLAVRGKRVWLGLRGPVLNGHAVILEMRMRLTGAGHLKPVRLDHGRRYRTHLIPTEGDGLRDLALDGDDLLLLVGTTLANDGRSAVLRWRNAVAAKTSGVVPASAFELAADLPYRSTVDNPEGIALWDKNQWMVVHDSPAPERLGAEPPSIRTDIWEFA